MSRVVIRVRRSVVLLTAGVLALASVAPTAGCRKHSASEKSDSAAVPVRIAKVERRTLRPSFEVVGLVQADPKRLATVTAAASGLVERLEASEGTQIHQNDLILQLDERKARTDLDRAQAAFDRLVAKPRPEELVQARGTLAKMKSAHDLAAARLKKTQEVRAKTPELVPEVQFLEDQRNEQIAKAEMDAAQAQLDLLEKGPRAELRREAQVEVTAAKLQLEFCRVIAPISGQVVELKARVGQRADVGTLLATIIDTSEVVVQARVPGQYLGGLLQVIRGDGRRTLAEVRCPSFPDELFEAKSGWLGQQTEASTGDVPVKLHMPNPKGLLRVGMTVRVKVYGPAVEDLAIPEIAFTVNEEGHHIVTLVKDGKAAPTEIELAPEGGVEVRADGWVRVVKGLQEGDVVAVENGYALPEGTPVTVLPSKTPEPKQP
jgi:RND family efflux transporter MFP subunit